jgi:hypothetical protein
MDEDRERPPKLKEEPYKQGCRLWISHNLWCPYRRHRRSSVLCSRCSEKEGCTKSSAHEYKLRRERAKYFLALWGIQRRLLPEVVMVVSGEEEYTETDEE